MQKILRISFLRSCELLGNLEKPVFVVHCGGNISGYMDIVFGCGRYGIFSFNMHGYMDIVLGCGRYGLG
jgi:hypothetical protein